MGQVKAMPSANKIKIPTVPKVIRIFDKNATAWDYKTNPYINYINYDVVKDMLSKGLTTLTGTKRHKRCLENYFIFI